MAEFTDAEVYADLSSDDDLSVVIRASIHIEHQMDALIAACTFSPLAIRRLGLDYDRKIDMCLAVGLPERFRPPLSAVGSIRNNFAHTIKARLTKSDVDAVYQAFAPDHKDIVQRTYSKLTKKHPGRWGSIKELPLLMRFTAYAVTLRAALVIANREVKAHAAVQGDSAGTQ